LATSNQVARRVSRVLCDVCIYKKFKVWYVRLEKNKKEIDSYDKI
jgi:hypothetical protein